MSVAMTCFCSDLPGCVNSEHWEIVFSVVTWNTVVWDFIWVNLTWKFHFLLMYQSLTWWCHPTKSIQKQMLLNFITGSQVPQILLMECTEYKFVGKCCHVYLETPISLLDSGLLKVLCFPKCGQLRLVVSIWPLHRLHCTYIIWCWKTFGRVGFKLKSHNIKTVSS